MISYVNTIIIVEDELKSRKFYEEVLEQKLKSDFGACQVFESGLALQRKSSVTGIYRLPQEIIRLRSNNAILYFETEDLESVAEKLSSFKTEYVHDIIELEWGQRSISFYDLDGHIIDVSEQMQIVFKRYQHQGMTLEEIAHRTEHPLNFVMQCLDAN